MTSAADRSGTLGGVSIRLAPDILPEERYQRRYVPVEPKSQEIPGTGGDKIAPESTIATWHIDDWSAGEGDLRWRQGSKRYNTSSGIQVAPDGSGLVAAFALTTTQLSGDFTQGARVGRDGTSSLVAADDTDGTLYLWNDGSKEWGASWTISATAGATSSIAWVTPAVFVATDTSIFKVTSGGYTTHYASWPGSPPGLVSFLGRLYGLSADDLYDIDTSTATTRTLKYDSSGAASGEEGLPRMTTSDVGPTWFTPHLNGSVFIYEFNVASDTGYAVGTLPNNTYPYSILFYSGIYFVSFRYATKHSLAGDAYIYYKNGGQQGVVGPFPAASTASEPILLAGVVGDRLYVTIDGRIFAYDLTSGGITEVSAEAASFYWGNAYTFGKDIFFADANLAGKVDRLDTEAYDTSEGTLDTGRHDFGYLGLRKTLQSVTVRCEENLTSGDTVGLKYAVDGGSFVTATGTVSSGESSKTWVISTNASTVRGTDFELQLLINPDGSDYSPKIISVTAEATGSEDRLEWVLLLDLSDNNLQAGQVTLDGLKALKTNHAVVQFTDPWTVLTHTAAETFDVTVEDVILPHSLPGGTPTATVLLRSAGTV